MSSTHINVTDESVIARTGLGGIIVHGDAEQQLDAVLAVLAEHEIPASAVEILFVEEVDGLLKRQGRFVNEDGEPVER